MGDRNNKTELNEQKRDTNRYMDHADTAFA